MNIQSNAACDPYWEHADWLPPWYILDQWCQQDDRCKQAKQQALFTACEKGIVVYRRNDGKDFDDPVHELSRRGILLIDRASCIARLQEKSPCAACFGRSIWMLVSASFGATLSNAARIRSARWDFRSELIGERLL